MDMSDLGKWNCGVLHMGFAECNQTVAVKEMNVIRVWIEPEYSGGDKKMF